MRLRGVLFAIAIALGTMATASPTGSPQASPQTASAQATSLPAGVPYASPKDPVHIASIELPSDTIHGGDVATATVLTTSNAAAVTARLGNLLFDVPKTAPGTFVLAVRVPKLPFPSYRAHVVITAIRADGASAQTTVSIKIKY